MDLGLVIRVLWRFRVLVVVGTLLAATAALLSHVRVEIGEGAPKLAYRSTETWTSSTTLLVTQQGFPEGVSNLDSEASTAPQKEGEPRRYSDPTRFNGLAIVYAKLAVSDEVRGMIRKAGPLKGRYSAQPVKTDDGATYLPFVLITAESTSARGAQDLARRATNALRQYLARYQDANRIPADARVQLELVNEPTKATLAAGRSPVKPMFILLIGIAATLGLAFALENVRPRVAVVASAGGPVGVASETRPVARTGR